MRTSSYSFMGGGPSFPTVDGRPRWIDTRTCVLPVKLEPGRVYRLGLNGPTATGFQSTDGVALAARPWFFRTAPVDPDAVERWSDERRADATNALREAITTRYSHRDRLGIDWTAVLDRNVALREARTSFEFGSAAAAILDRARDPHVQVLVDGASLSSFTHTATPNWNIPILARSLASFEQHSKDVLSGRTHDDIGYLAIATLDRDRAESIEPAFAALASLSDCEALVLDLRMNGGGDELIARRFASRFADEPVVYARHRFVDPEGGHEFGPLVDRVLEPANSGTRFDRPVVVLTSNAVMSSAEAFVLMMRACGATIVGANTAGSTGNPQSITIDREIVARLPSWQAFAPDGGAIEGVGITPDIVMTVDPVALKTADPVFERALAVIRRH